MVYVNFYTFAPWSYFFYIGDPKASNHQVFYMQHNMLETGIQTYSTNIKFHIQFFTIIIFSIYAAHKNHYANLGYLHSG